jgi:hypothetical protein
MTKISRKPVGVKKLAGSKELKQRDKANTGKELIWRFERVKLPYKSSVPLEVEIEGDAQLAKRVA